MSPKVSGKKAKSSPSSRRKKTAPGTPEAAARTNVETTTNIPVVGLGASAGGLQAFSDFLEVMPENCGMAFVLIQHLDPEHESLMANLLASHTGMTVSLAEDGAPIKPDHVYVIPPKATLLLREGKVRLTAPVERHGARMPVDAFFHSLAEECKEQAIGIVLSGTGADGTLGLKAIRTAGGLAIVQDPTEAAHDGMPRSAITHDAADEVLALAEMPETLLRYIEHPYFTSKKDIRVLGDRAREILDDVVVLLKQRTPINFELYKEGTLLRRIERRMGIHRVSDGAAYLNILEKDEQEADQLAKDLLISVTGFFRDPDVFEHLETGILPVMLKEHPVDRTFRVWVAGCATGEEAYTIGILLIEQATALGRRIKFQIFATDLDEHALGLARNGIFPETIEADISRERLNQFFSKEDHSYHVKPELRESIVFATHNLLSDAPFSKMDLVTCRNVMIYLDPRIQGRIMQLFHFALNNNGILMLGTSETANAQKGLFEAEARNHRIYRRIGSRSRYSHFELPIMPASRRTSRTQTSPIGSKRLPTNPGEMARRALLDRYAPAAVLVNNKSEGIYFSGPVDRYLKIPSGEAGQDLLAMVREGLRVPLRSAIQSVLDTGEAAGNSSASIKRRGTRQPVTINIDPLGSADDKLLLVTFADAPVPAESIPEAWKTADQSAVEQLEKELDTTRCELKATIRDLEASNEELKASNEEAMSMNEEFQSTNEELETSKEELQSLNEELTTLNNQLQQKVDEHRIAVDDLNNLLNSSRVATIFIDQQLCIKHFTPSTRSLFNLIVSDIGRPFSDITQKFKDPRLQEDIQTVLASLSPIEREIRVDDGSWFLRRILPYRTQDNKIDGVVITFNDVSDLKDSQQQAQAAQTRAEAIIDTIREPLLVLNSSLQVESASRSFYSLFASAPEETEGRYFWELGNGQWNVPALRDLMESVIPSQKAVEAFEVELVFSGIGERSMLLNARQIEFGGWRPDQILLAFEDITAQRKFQEGIEEKNARLRSIVKSAQLAIITIDDNGTIESFSQAATDVFGYDAKEVIGKNVNILMPEPVRSKHDSYLDAYKKTGKKKIIGLGREVTGRRKDGSLIPLDLSVNETIFDHQRIFTAVIRDLTLEKKRQAELEHAQKMDAMGQMTGGIAHDFNNLLTVIMGNLEMLEARATSSKHSQSLAEAMEAVELGSDLTNGLLAFGRRLPLDAKSLDINELVSQMCRIIERTIPETIELDAALTPTPLPVVVDESRLKTAILNLALNARDAMQDGGKLIIETSQVELDADFRSLHPDIAMGDYVALSVTDSGVGMSAETRRQAFEPFFTTKDIGAGSGLGLSMVYGFAKQSKGQVTIYSEPALGTTVTIYLPKDINALKDEVDSSDKTLLPIGGAETILVVEDDVRVRHLTIRRLEDLGYRVLAAEHGPQALERMQETPDIDLLFSDIVMPGGISGTELARQARKQRPDLHVLLTSGYADDAIALEKGLPIIRKPYSSSALARKIREVLDT